MLERSQNLSGLTGEQKNLLSQMEIKPWFVSHQPSVLSLYWLCYPSSWVTSRRNLHAIFSSWKVGIISDQNELQLNFSHTSFGVNPQTTRLNHNPHNSFRNKTCRQTHLPHYALTQFNLRKKAITGSFWSFHSGVIEDFVFWYVALLNLLSGSKHFKGISGITHSKTQTSHPRKLQFSEHNMSGNISQPEVKDILMFTLNNNVCSLRPYWKLNYTKPCPAGTAQSV